MEIIAKLYPYEQKEKEEGSFLVQHHRSSYHHSWLHSHVNIHIPNIKNCMRKLTFITITITLLLASCSDKKTDVLSDFEAFTEELVYNSKDYTQDDWNVAQNQFGQINEELEQYDFSDEELNRIGELKGQCSAVFAKHTASNLKNTIQRVGKEVEGFLDGFTEGLK